MAKALTNNEPAESPKKEKAKPTELQAMGRICNLLNQYDAAARRRMLSYVNEACSPPAPGGGIPPSEVVPY